MAAELVDMIIQESIQAVGDAVTDEESVSHADDVEKSGEACTETVSRSSSVAERSGDSSTSHHSTESRRGTESSSEDGDEHELSKEQRRALDNLRVQTARDDHEYLKQHPEVRAMLTLLVRETVRQDRPPRDVAGELFRSERYLVDAVRRMLRMKPVAPRLGSSAEEKDSSLELTSSESLPSPPRRTRATSPTGVDRPRSPARFQDFAFIEEIRAMARASVDAAFDHCLECSRRRSTPVPWAVEEALEAMIKDGEDLHRRESTAPLLEEARMQVTAALDRAQFHVDVCRMVTTAAERASYSEASEEPDGDDAVVPVSRRDTPAPWGISVEQSEMGSLRMTISSTAVVEEPEETMEENPGNN